METNNTNVGKLLWSPTPESVRSTNLTRYLDWLRGEKGLAFTDYPALWQWSVNDVEAFWTSIVEFYDVRFFQPATAPLSSHEMPGAHWFPGATLNYAEHALRNALNDESLAIIFEGEAEGAMRREEITRADLLGRVTALAASLRSMGVKPGDRVVGFLPNIPETVIAFLATASVGAVWSSCPVELSSKSVLDRLVQIAPKVLFTITNYRYGGKVHDRSIIVEEIAAGLPTLEHCVFVPSPAATEPSIPKQVRYQLWNEVLAAEGGELVFEPVSFEHPLWILYSSGTTGIPKAIVQGHGGILLEHLKALSLHLDLRTGDRFFWYSTTGWMMWNFLVSGLLLPGVSIVVYDGSPKYPTFQVLWDLAERSGVSYFGTSAPYLLACIKEGVDPGKSSAFEKLRGIGSTGSPLSPEGFEWVYDHVKRDLILGSISGGTDVCTAIVLSQPHGPVHAGKIQCLGLGAKVEAWSDSREPLIGQVGELVMSEPFPSMPIFFWSDVDGSRMQSSYYEKFPGAWGHGDWIEIDAPAGPCVIHGRSDATLNRGGVRMGTADFYSVVEDLPEIADSLVIDMGGMGRADRLLLFVALREGAQLDDALRARINGRLKVEVSPRHIPDAIYEVSAVPRTLNGKKLEVPIKRILVGMPVDKVINRDTLSNPAALKYFIDLSATLVK